MKYYEVWIGDFFDGVYSESELENVVWPFGTEFFLISYHP